VETEYQRLDQFYVPNGFRGRSMVTVQLWWIVQATLFAWSPQFMFGWRCFLLKLFGAEIGKEVKIRSTVKVTYPWKVKVGDYVWIGDDTTLYSLGTIDIGSHVAIAHRVYLCAGSHDYTKVTFDILAKGIKIESQVWLPNDVFVGPGVTIGKGTVVGARSSVFSDLLEGMIYTGSPAKPIKPRVMSE
jgi:putative colanic acid biosynthesis acetyltransferase WcaF